MTEKKTCYNCGNKNCHIFYFSVKQDVAEHHETYEYTEFDCVNHDKWKELKVEEIRTDNTETLKNALGRIEKLENNAAMEERNKANEWHWPVKGNPIKGKKDTLYLLMLCSNSRLKYAFGEYTPAVCYWDEQWERFEILEETKGNRNVNPNDILAWKEFSPPKFWNLSTGEHNIWK